MRFLRALRLDAGLDGAGGSYQDGIHLNFATGQYYTKAVGAVPTVSAFTSLFTFTGGNQSLYMGSAGLLVASVTNTPRIEYSSTGSVLGLLMEAARTNLGLWSDDHTNVAWVKTTMTTAKTSTGPDGTASSATRLTATGANSLSVQTVVSASATRVYSVWMKRITGTGDIDMTVDGGTGWTTKTLTTSWQRFEITQAAVTNPVFGIRIVTDTDAIDVYGSQLESAAFASSLIPTTTLAVARTVDSCIRTLSTEFSATAGTVVVAGRASGGQDASLGQLVWAFDDGTTANPTRLLRPAASNAARFVVVSAATLDGTFTNSTNYKHAAAWAVNDFAVSFNGGAVLTDTLGAVSPGLLTLGLGCGATGTPMNGHIKQFDYYPERKANIYLQNYSV